MTDNYFLSRGRHNTGEHGRCAMEWVAFVAGEPHTDRPVCVSPLLRSFCTSLNDSLDDEERQKLRPYLARCIGTAADGLDERRTWMCTDWLVREFAPLWLELAGLDAEASSLRSLKPVVSDDAARVALPALNAARGAVEVSETAGCDALWSGTAHALRIALNATRGSYPSREAAAALHHSRGLPAPTSLQQSLFTLLDRMLPTVPVELPADRQRIALELAG